MDNDYVGISMQIAYESQNSSLHKPKFIKGEVHWFYLA